MKPANNGAVYACIYADLAEVFRRHGYALCIHGSLAKDFDLVAVPWADSVSGMETVLAAMSDEFCLEVLGNATPKNHGRVAYTIAVSFGEVAIDLSFVCVEAIAAHMREREGGVE